MPRRSAPAWPGHPTSVESGVDVVVGRLVDHPQGLGQHHAVSGRGEVVVDRRVLTVIVPVPRAQADTGDGGLAPCLWTGLGAWALAVFSSWLLASVVNDLS